MCISICAELFQLRKIMTVDTRIELLKIALALAIADFETENDDKRTITQIFEDCDTTVIDCYQKTHS
jgi:uncharacterized tellurite resistance protein B-like protein